VVAFGAKVPEPEVVQVPPVAPPPTVPPKPVLLAFRQIVWLGPVASVGGA
jgi:hypothetical protein